MKITVNEQPQRFHLAFKKWEPAVGHEIQVGEYRFCAIPLGNRINVSEVTTGMRLLVLPVNNRIWFETSTKEKSIKFFEGLGHQIAKQIMIDKSHFDKEFARMKKVSFDKLGEMPPIENVDITA